MEIYSDSAWVVFIEHFLRVLERTDEARFPHGHIPNYDQAESVIESFLFQGLLG